MPILVNMMLDMIGCYQFPDLRHESEQMKARKRFLTNEACEEMFGHYKKEDENNFRSFIADIDPHRSSI